MNYEYFSPARVVQAQYHRDNPVVEVFNELQAFIKEFEATLNPDEEVGAKLTSFGKEVTIHVRTITAATPCMLKFDGHIDGTGARVQLIQHVTQLNVLLLALPVKQDEKRPVGFVYPND